MANPVGKKLTAAQHDEIVRLYDEGLTLRVIADRLGYDYKTVRLHTAREEARRGKAYAKERDQRLGQLASKLMRNLDKLDSLSDSTKYFDSTVRDEVAIRAEQRQHIAQLSKLLGLDQPQKVEHSGTLDVRAIEWVEEVVDPAGTTEQT